MILENDGLMPYLQNYLFAMQIINHISIERPLSGGDPPLTKNIEEIHA
jgi:hypothetical protein